tara:strand:+ start:163 stop:1341 length:1179 start_codon:yes stop_codon:yes gene_type:complete
MAKKLPWGSFSTDDLVINKEDDIFAPFQFLSLVGLSMVKLNELHITENAVRGLNDTVSQKIVGLTGSLFYGWDRTSWPIPFVQLPELKEAFDRRHTVKVCRSIADKVQAANDVPAAEYRRVYPSNGGVFNAFLDTSILTMAAMWGNVHGPIVEDTKDHMFETACVRIIKDEQGCAGADSKRPLYGLEPHEEDLITKPFIRTLLKHMGCYQRYNNNEMVVNRIAGRVYDALQDEDSVVGKLGKNNNEEDIDCFIKESPDWQPHNTEDDNYIYVVQQIRDTDTFCYTYAERLLTRVCQNEKSKPNKITKVLIWNKSEASEAKKIVASRTKYKKRLNSSWQARRNNALEPIKQVLNDDIVEKLTKKLSDLKLEIWNMHQIEGEDEPFEMAFDTEE